MRTNRKQKSKISLRAVDGQGLSSRTTAVVAGGAGFLGSHLCQRLIDDNYQVICIDSFLTGRAENVASLIEDSRFSLVNQDVIERVAIKGEVDEIYNLACAASPPKYQQNPVHTMQTCVNGTLNLLKLAQAKEARFMQASTSEVYGDPEVHPQPESYFGNVNPFGPRSCYDEGKRAAEALCHDFADRHETTVKVARIFNTYGPQMLADDGRVVSNFINQALNGTPITIYGSGKQTRSFCYVDDLIDGIVRLMRSPDSVSTPVNLGNPTEFTMLDLAKLVIQKTDSQSKLTSCALPIDDPKQRRPDISLAQQELGWQPKISLSQGLDKTIAYFADQMEFRETKVQESA